ncbi:hypothetical protein MGN70_014726 [Eutypa lata]|nr:hypothetical protein MGN70_014726 [Eutypa lata]
MSPLSKIALLLSAAASVHALGTGWPTEGTQRGTIRVYSWDEEKEVGCVTKEGQWTVSYGYCDAFNAKSLGPITVDREWTELEMRTSEGAQCWFPDNSTMELVCGSEVDDTETLWLHASDYQSDVLVHSRALDSYVPVDGKAPTGEEAVALKGEGQVGDGNNYQLIWVRA